MILRISLKYPANLPDISLYPSKSLTSSGLKGSCIHVLDRVVLPSSGTISRLQFLNEHELIIQPFSSPC
ncbi:hypothetical protein EYC80_009063 [Monilinia laxa]|uniref:Uncharacterized protein n=1 Tax=Monilinia laxa TaxID=61186 RepID=A0A5N6K2B8_MONLA|nr:hypothetical protein EYC80_009063 [Monilinia laxa]